MSWAQRLKRVFTIDIEPCSECGGGVKVIPKALAALAGQVFARIEEPLVTKKIPNHLKEKASTAATVRLPESRASLGWMQRPARQQQGLIA